jgi:hypothetical protein
MFQIFFVIIETIADPPLRRLIRPSARNSEDPPCVIRLRRHDCRPAWSVVAGNLDTSRGEPSENIVLRA